MIPIWGGTWKMEAGEFEASLGKVVRFRSGWGSKDPISKESVEEEEEKVKKLEEQKEGRRKSEGHYCL